LDETYVHPFVNVSVPTGVVTTMLPRPALPAAVTAVIWVAESTVKEAVEIPLKLTAVAPVKPVPVITTVVPPVVVPDGTSMDVTIGGSAAATSSKTARSELFIADIATW
jgi:hypothetical protein